MWFFASDGLCYNRNTYKLVRIAPFDNNKVRTMIAAVQTQQEILTVLKAHKARLQQEFPLHRLALFGSWARGDQTPSSDVDILVEVAPSIGLRFVTLAQRLEALLGRKVDLVSRRAIKPALWAYIEPDIIDV